VFLLSHFFLIASRPKALLGDEFSLSGGNDDALNIGLKEGMAVDHKK
jgi:hypothetical protein